MGDDVRRPDEHSFGMHLDRRRFLGVSAVLAASGLLAACKKVEDGGGGGTGATGVTGSARPPLEQEPGGLQVFDWGGYGDGAYYPKEEKQYLWKQYLDATGDTPSFILFEDDDSGYAAFHETSTLAEKYGLSVYDAAYLEVARRRQALRRAAKRSGAKVL